MDVIKALRELYAEKKRLDRAIAALEAKQRANSRQMPQNTSPRGRRSMSAAERKEVSRRMTNYWAARKGGMSASQTVAEPHVPAVEASRASA